MRLLLPLRSSETPSTGSGLSARAMSRISSGSAEDRITNFMPGSVLLEAALRVAAEQDLAAAGGHFGVAEHLGEVVDEEVALQRADPPHFLVPRPFEIDIAPIQAQASRVEEPIALHPLESSRPQVRQMRIVMGKLGLVAYDRNRAALPP